MPAMRLYLINPSNPLVSIVKIKESHWNRYRVWKPLSLMVLAGLTPPGVENLDRGREPRRAGLFGHAYPLMTNHYHLIIETPDGNLSCGMRQLNGIYTQRYNRAHHTVGYVLQGRFKSILIDKEFYCWRSVAMWS
jgi:hypothetical protein